MSCKTSVPTTTLTISAQLKVFKNWKFLGALMPLLVGQGDQIKHALRLNLFLHAFWQGIRRENLDRKKGLICLSIQHNLSTTPYCESSCSRVSSLYKLGNRSGALTIPLLKFRFGNSGISLCVPARIRIRTILLL